MINTWKTAHAHCKTPPTKNQIAELNSIAIRMKIISPANMFPNKRSPSDKGLAINVTNSSRKFMGIAKTDGNG